MNKKTQAVNTHYPNLLISITVCDSCWDVDSMTRNTDNCEVCGTGNHIYFGTDCIRKFCDYLFTDVAKRAEMVDGYVHVFAHNARGYDSQFLFQDIRKRNFTDTNVIMQGRKILKLTAGNVNLIDSLSFFLQPLSALPKAFGLNANIAKGHFPHYFNIEDNYDYVGPMPSLQYYGVEYMKPDQAKMVREWHNEQVQNDYVFNFKNELIKYCENDVDILIKSVMVFRKNVLDTTGIDPYTSSFTLAALGLKVFRTRFVRDNQTIGITPIKGYKKRGNYSK